MSTKPDESVVDQSVALLSDIILHEYDLSEEAKNQFEYHTKILDALEQNRRSTLENDQISPIGRHFILSRLEKSHSDCKQVLNYAAANRKLLIDSLPDFGPLFICGLPRTGSTLLYNLLACDPNCRAPLFIDMFIECVPPISRSDVVERERRTLLANNYVEMRNQLLRRSFTFNASHPSFPTEEDFLIMGHAGVLLFTLLTSPAHQPEIPRFIYDNINKDFGTLITKHSCAP
jgi:hypothetical protein